jgi:hypothetical protein
VQVWILVGLLVGEALRVSKRAAGAPLNPVFCPQRRPQKQSSEVRSLKIY